MNGVDNWFVFYYMFVFMWEINSLRLKPWLCLIHMFVIVYFISEIVIDKYLRYETFLFENLLSKITLKYIS